MATELTPSTIPAMMAHIALQADLRSKATVSALALLVEKQAKINASTGSHPYGTPTPASPGTGPARISGTLVRSITHSEVKRSALAGWETQVGTAVGLYPTYKGKRGSFTSKTPANKYGYYLETEVGNRRGLYPFLGPAFHFVVRGPAQIIYDQVYGAPGWLRLT